MTTDVTDPWRDIQKPDQASNINLKRVDSFNPWNLSWAIDIHGNCLLVLQHDVDSSPSNRMPKLQGLSIKLTDPDSSNQRLLILRLTDLDQRDIFARLCNDIVTATESAANEKEAVEIFMARTWRWHRLLRGGRMDRLSDEEQRGLIGELVFLNEVVIEAQPIHSAIQSWTGPLAAPKDFELGGVALEVKAMRGGAVPHVTISSEHQLDREGFNEVFLGILEMSRASEDDENAVTLTNVARTLLHTVRGKDALAAELLEQRLVEAGFDWAHDYSDCMWIIGNKHVFEVSDEFPRIAPHMFPVGASHVRYSLEIPSCEPWRRDEEVLKSSIRNGAI